MSYNSGKVSKMLINDHENEKNIEHFFNDHYPEIVKYWNSENQDWHVDEEGNITAEAYKAKGQYEEEIWGWIAEKQQETISEIIAHL